MQARAKMQTWVERASDIARDTHGIQGVRMRSYPSTCRRRSLQTDV